MSGSMSNLWGLLGDQGQQQPAQMPGLLDPEAMRGAGMQEGLLRAAAAMAEASRPRMLMREGPGPGLMGGLIGAASGFVQGNRAGRQGYMQQQTQEATMARESAMQGAMSDTPDEQLPAPARQMRGIMAGLPPQLRSALPMLSVDQRGEVIGKILSTRHNAVTTLPPDQVAALGMPPGTVVQRDSEGKISVVERPRSEADRLAIAQAGRATTNVNLPPVPAQESAFQGVVGRSSAEGVVAMRDAGTRSANQIRDLERFGRALESFPTGAAAQQRLSVAQWAQQLGVPETALPESLRRQGTASAEEMRGITGQLLSGAIGPGGFPAANFSNADMQAVRQTLPNIENTPDGNRRMIAAARAGHERNIEVARSWREWSMRNGNTAESYERFQSERLPQIIERDVIAPLAGSPGGPPRRGTGTDIASPPQAMGTGGVARPANMADVQRLSPGARFVIPDGSGRIGTVPAARPR